MAANIAPRADERLLPRPGGRQLAYAEAGNPSSRTVFLFFPGVFAIGYISHLPPIVEKLDAHLLVPTPTGMGLTSPRPSNVAYSTNLVSDIRALLEHTHPNGVDALYVGGSSYGTVMAQMLYGAGYGVFPAGRAIKGCVLISAFSPFRLHTGHAQGMSWPNYIALGPPSMLPFRLIQRVMRPALAPKMRNVEDARVFIANNYFNNMSAKESIELDRRLESRGETFDSHVTSMAERMVRSVAQTWDGFMEVSEVLHSNWGFDPRTLDAEHAKPMLVVTSSHDALGAGFNQWIVDNYQGAVGHDVSDMVYLDDVWQELVDLSSRASSD